MGGHAVSAAAEADTFPKLLIRNARLYADRPAIRHKDLGIWQVWTWSEVLAELSAFAVGLNRLGLQRGDRLIQKWLKAGVLEDGVLTVQ